MKPMKLVKEVHADFECTVQMSSVILRSKDFAAIRHAFEALLVEQLGPFDLEMTEMSTGARKIFGDLTLVSDSFSFKANLKDFNKEPTGAG